MSTDLLIVVLVAFAALLAVLGYFVGYANGRTDQALEETEQDFVRGCREVRGQVQPDRYIEPRLSPPVATRPDPSILASARRRRGRRR
jgi:hypothetical protein